MAGDIYLEVRADYHVEFLAVPVIFTHHFLHNLNPLGMPHFRDWDNRGSQVDLLKTWIGTHYRPVFLKLVQSLSILPPVEGRILTNPGLRSALVLLAEASPARSDPLTLGSAPNTARP